MNSPEVKFAISVPVGGYHPLLPMCLESLARQAADLEVAFLDASADQRVADLADQYSSLFSYRRHGPDLGQSDAILEGWENIGGDVLGWLNADDFLYPDALEKVASRFRSNETTEIVFGHSAICDEQGGMTGYHLAVNPDANSLRVGGSISQPSCFFKRDAYEAAGGVDRDLHYTMDWDLWLKLLDNGAVFSFLDEPLSVVFWGDGTKTASFHKQRRDELKLLIDRYAPVEQKTRVFRGFATQAALDLYCPAPFRRVLQKYLGRNPKTVFGMGVGGVIADETVIHWFHLDDTPRRKLQLQVSASKATDIAANRKIASVEKADREIEVTFAEPVRAGEHVAVTLKNGAQAAASFYSAAWL